jgi:membrane-bound lytic murein transglycosylase B
MGYGQFISSSYRAYAIDYDGDGYADLFNSVDDAIGSIANYLYIHGWKKEGEIIYDAHPNNVRKVFKPNKNFRNLYH